MKKIIAIIPARMASSRFPGKPLKTIHGIPMVGHVYFRSKMCNKLDEVYIATCDQEIMDYAASIGAPAIMTSDTHERASDRAAEAMLKIEGTSSKQDIVVMIQGDEPMITPQMISDAINPLVESPESILISNLMADIETVEEFEDPNEVKVVVDNNNNALYFSREPIPSRKKGVKEVPMKKQVCIIPFQRDFLLEYNEITPTPLEIIESVDMMRILENGMGVKMVPTETSTIAVDTQKDLDKVIELMDRDTLMKLYQQ